MTFCIREVAPGELPLILSSWLGSQRANARRNHTPRGQLSREDFTFLMRPIIEDTIGRSRLLAATLPEVPEEVLSWACIERDLVHYGYTKAAYRSRGAFCAILFDAGVLPGVLRLASSSAAVLPWLIAGRARIAP